MRPLILSLALAAAAMPALAQAPSREALALASRAAHSAQPRVEQGLQSLVESLAKAYQDNALRQGQPVDSNALEAVTRSEEDAIKPLLWDGMARLYAQTYSVDELKALNAFYRDNPGAPPQGLPTSLLAKNDDIQRGEQVLIGQIGPRIMQDFFGDYCSRAPCTNDTRRAAGLPVRAGN
jgi:hypothetical protein